MRDSMRHDAWAGLPELTGVIIGGLISSLIWASVMGVLYLVM